MPNPTGTKSKRTGKNTKAQGKKYEKEVRDILEADGWVVETCNPKLMFIGPGKMISKSHDFFGCWDLIAKRIGEKTLWVQVSVWEHAADKRKQVQNFPWDGDYDRTAIYLRIRGKNAHFKVLYGHNSYEWNGAVRMIPKPEVKKDEKPT